MGTDGQSNGCPVKETEVRGSLHLGYAMEQMRHDCGRWMMSQQVKCYTSKELNGPMKVGMDSAN
jgi:hypothetical protein